MTLPRYPAYKDSGVEWLGEVPAHWRTVPMKYLVSFRSGGTPSKEVEAYWDGDVPWASAKDMKTERLADTTDHLTDHALAEGAAALVPAGAVLVVVRGMILARLFPVCLLTQPMAINQDLKAVLAGSELVSDFLAWVLRGTSEESLRRLDEAGHGTKALRMEAWASLALPLPTLSEQAAIAAFLDRETAKIDALTGEQERLIELLAEKRRAVVSHAVTNGLDPNAPMKDSGIPWLGEVPAHWEVKALKRFASIRYGIGEPPTYREEGSPLIRATNVHEGRVLKDGLVFVDPKDIPERRIIWLQEGDVVVVRSGAYTGDSAIIRRELCPAIAGFDMVVRLDIDVPDFLQFALLSKYLKQDQIDLERTRAAQPHLNAEELGGCRVLLPPLDEQRTIVAHLDRMATELGALTTEATRAVTLLKERRAALISAAVTGKIDVRGRPEDAA